MRKTIFLTVLMLLMTTVSAQTIVRGNVVNEQGEAVEYVSIGFDEDSVGVISDVRGHFTLTIPAGRTKDLSFTHVSYQDAVVPYTMYSKGNDLKVVLKDKVVELTEVVIGKKNKSNTLSGRSMIKMGTVGFVGKQNGDTEWGPILKNGKDYVLSEMLLAVAKCKYDECVLSFNIYELQGKKFVNIMNKPIYKRISPADDGKKFSVSPDEHIVLKGKKKYCICVSVVDHKGDGGIFFPANYKTSYARNAVKGKMKKLPACPPIIVKGYRVED
jgi:hypothetical protein